MQVIHESWVCSSTSCGNQVSVSVDQLPDSCTDRQKAQVRANISALKAVVLCAACRKEP